MEEVFVFHIQEPGSIRGANMNAGSLGCPPKKHTAARHAYTTFSAKPLHVSWTHGQLCLAPAMQRTKCSLALRRRFPWQTAQQVGSIVAQRLTAALETLDPKRSPELATRYTTRIGSQL
jgi:hypothetical protein